MFLKALRLNYFLRTQRKHQRKHNQPELFKMYFPFN